MTVPHPIPYQGSKRRLAPLIARHFPADVRCMYEPFAGSAAMTLHAAQHGLAQRFVLADSLAPLVELWRAIIEHPAQTGARYRRVWEQQSSDGAGQFNAVRARYNRAHEPVDLLYLICRCVKNAVRFNANGEFTQSADRRRLGMHPDRMQAAIDGASRLLRNRVELRCGDWRQTTADAHLRDLVYLDPPYLGTTIGRDRRYHRQLPREALIEGIGQLRQRDLRFVLSYDGCTGTKSYGPPLPRRLGLRRLQIEAGRSAQATLSGRSETTVESVYLSPACTAAPLSRFSSGASTSGATMEVSNDIATSTA